MRTIIFKALALVVAITLTATTAGAQFNAASLPRPVASAANTVTELPLATTVKAPQPDAPDAADFTAPVSSPEVQSGPLAPPAPEIMLADPHVSAPVSPAETAGLPPAPRVEPFPQLPREMPGGLPLPGRAGAEVFDPVVQRAPLAVNIPAPLTNWEGINNTTGIYPPDTDGQVGPNHYVQIVNSGAEGAQIRVWNKAGTQLYDYGMNSMWPSGDPCNLFGNGDPVVLYDQMADRWLLTQFAVPGPFYECIAVSQGPTPTNNPSDWYLYTFEVHPTKMNDYPKLGIWPDGYYMSANQFDPSFAGAGVWVFDRAAMLNGAPATFQYFDLEPVDPSLGGLLPSNLMGDALPPNGAPNYFVAADVVASALHIFEFHTDWDTPTNTTFTLVKSVPVAPFDANMCSGARSCIPQPDTFQGVDAISDRLMMHLWYRNFGDHEVLVTNHTVDVGGDHAGIRWYEVRDPGPNALVFQQGTYAPDEHHRWMGSIAMDSVGNIALGYSIASETMYPSIRYTGRLAGDPLGVMAQGEEIIIAGGGSQTGTGGRWGDYSAMSVDPVDDCTFWYTQQYYATTSPVGWQTRVASFQFPSCLAATGTLVGTVEDASTTGLIEQARVTAESNPSYVTLTRPDGSYGFAALPTGTYTVTAAAYGFQPEEIVGVSVTEGTTTTQDFALTPLDTFVISGTVTDATTGWPLYASIDVEAEGYAADPVWTDPVSGYYSVTLASGTVHTFTVEAWVNGYDAGVRTVGPLTADSTEDFALDADRGICTAPGYAPTATVYSEDLEAGDGGYSGEVDWDWGTPASWPFECASGSNCWGTNLSGDYSANTNQTLTSTVIDIPDVPPGTFLTAHWQQAWSMEPGFDYASAEINISDGGWVEVWSSSSTDNDWTPMSFDISAADGGTVQFRWRMTSDSAVENDGYFIDDVEITQGCTPAIGGLVVGNVYDAATNSPQVGATVSNDSGRSTTAVATPLDDAVDEAFYTLFSPTASHVFTATGGYGLGADVQTVGVVMGDTVRQDFFLPDAQSYVVSGRVRDANTDWPLYASIDIAGYPGDPFWNDPVSGYYSVTLAEGTPFNFIVMPWAAGYEIANIPVGPLSGDTTQDIAVDVDPVTCNAPGYEGGDQIQDGSFEAGSPNPFWSEGGDLASPLCSAATCGEALARTGDWFAWYGGWQTTNTSWVSQSVAIPVGTTTLSFWLLIGAEPGIDSGLLDVRIDGNTVISFTEEDAFTYASYTQVLVDISAYADGGFHDLEIRGTEIGTTLMSFIVDDVEMPGACVAPTGGGLVVGHVYDANTTLPINGATVTDEDGYSADTGPTPDPAVDEAFYTIFSPAGTKTFTATTSTWGYGTDVHPAVGVVADDTVGLEIFNLPAGVLNYTPSGLSVTLREGMSTTVPLMLSNDGGVSIDFNLVEWTPSSNPTTVMNDPFRGVWAPGSLDAYDEPAWRRVQDLSAPLAPGDVLASWETGLAYARSAAYDRLNGTVWVNSPCEGWGGECRIVEYATDGTPTGRWYAYDWNVTYGPADMVYNPNTGMIWVVDVGQGDCIHELDPDSGWTGDRICGFASVSMRGLAYNPDTDTYYTGRYPYTGCPPDLCNTVFEFKGETWDQPGEVIASQNIGFGFEGLAYHPDAGSLFIEEFFTDKLHEYDLTWTEVTSFTVSGLTALGMDIDCDGNLWMSDGNTRMLLVDSNRPADLCPGLDWLSEDPTTGTIGLAPATSSIAVTFDAGAPSVTQLGEYTGMLRVNNTSPYGPVQIPVTMTVVALETAWDKAVWVSGERLTDTSYRGLLLNDTITIADRVWITSSNSITFSLVEEWSESLALESWEHTAGDVVVGSGMLTWTLEDGTPNAWHVLTKTFGVVSGAWTVDYITETLTVDGTPAQPTPITLEFRHVVPIYLPIIFRNQ